jgi:hypothetical protein
MRHGKHGSLAKRVGAAIVLGGMLVLIALPAVRSQEIHRNGFEGRQTSWLRGEDNVRAEEKAHNLSSDFVHLGSSSEFIQLVCPEGKNETNFATYYYPTQPAPISDDLSASIYLKANKAGVQLQARLVLPKERNPKQLDEPLTVILTGDTYRITRRWQKLEISNPVKLMKDQQQLLRAQLRRDIDLTDAYIDRLILNLYAGPGEIDAYIDDLEIGPVKPQQPPQPKLASTGPGVTATLPKASPPLVRNERGILVRMDYDKLLVGGQPFFFRAIRYTDAPLKTLRDAGFNTVWFDPSVSAERIEEAVSTHGFWIVPNLPLLGDPRLGGSATLTSRGGNDVAAARDGDALATSIIRFLSGDAVLFWDLGSALQGEKAEQLKRTAAAISAADPNRPLGADIWDSFGALTLPNQIKLVGTHRYPLMSSLELTSYRDWLMQRRRLASGNALNWTWVQTHVPDWQMQILCGKKNSDPTADPIGLQPEQIRLLTYLGLATGVQGLTFSSDRLLTDSRLGRDRWLMMALLNQEIKMLEPLLLSLTETPTWIETSNINVKAAVLHSKKGVLILPIWLGEGSQYVAPQGAIINLTMVVPLVPESAQPWEILPAQVRSLQYQAERKLSGMKITIPEFDLTSAIVFTSDLTPTGEVVKWQQKTRTFAPLAAQWACDLAAIELQKVSKTHAQLADVAPAVLKANLLLREAQDRLELAHRHEQLRDYTNAYREAMRAMGALRIVMRAHWEHAVHTLDLPSASPYAISFFTLPQHWELHRQLHGTSAGANALRDGDFESVAKNPEFVIAAQTAEEMLSKQAELKAKNVPIAKDGIVPKDQAPNAKEVKAIRDIEEKLKFAKNVGTPVTNLPGWTVQQQTLDPVDMEVLLVPSSLAKIAKIEKPKRKPEKYDPSTGYVPPPEPPEPTLGEAVLKLEIRPKIIVTEKDGKPQPAPAALERTYLAVNSPAVRLQPGSWVRISGWVRVPATIQASADGVLLFDSADGEGMGARFVDKCIWRQIHLYRQVPPTGVIWMTVALTGIGTVYFDDLKIEPLVSNAAQTSNYLDHFGPSSQRGSK